MKSVRTADELAALIPDGAMVAIPADLSGAPMSLARAMVRRGARDLHLVCLPTSGMPADLLIGAGCVSTLQTSGVTLGEFGTARRFTAALKAGRFRMLDSTCPAVHAGLQAGAKGVPFTALRGLLGSDLLAQRPDWRVIDNPFSDDKDPIVLLPAIRPDFAVFHAPFADRHGNVFIGPRRELSVMAQASRAALVTVEEIRDIDLMADDASAGSTLSAAYGAQVAVARRGSWPLSLVDAYDIDAAHLKHYTQAACCDADFDAYLREFVFAPAATE